MFKRLKVLWKLSELDILTEDKKSAIDKVLSLIKKNKMAKIVDTSDPFENIEQ